MRRARPGVAVAIHGQAAPANECTVMARTWNAGEFEGRECLAERQPLRDRLRSIRGVAPPASVGEDPRRAGGGAGLAHAHQRQAGAGCEFKLKRLRALAADDRIADDGALRRCVAQLADGVAPFDAARGALRPGGWRLAGGERDNQRASAGGEPARQRKRTGFMAG